LKHFNWELSDHLPYTPDLTPSDYHLFTDPKNWLQSQCFNNNEELMGGIKTWMCSQVADSFDTDEKEAIPRYDKCLNSSGDYVKK
jgi:hypothetical protein